MEIVAKHKSLTCPLLKKENKWKEQAYCSYHTLLLIIIGTNEY